MSLTEDISFDNRGEAVKFPLFRKLFLALVIILVALLSFGIGRLSVTGKEPIRIEYDPELTTNNSQPTTSQTASVITAIKGGGVVATFNLLRSTKKPREVEPDLTVERMMMSFSWP